MRGRGGPRPGPAARDRPGPGGPTACDRPGRVAGARRRGGGSALARPQRLPPALRRRLPRRELGVKGPVIAVVGPTAAGKSALSLALAHAVDGEVVNADSMQLYRGMDIGTAKLSPAERDGVPHHVLDIWDVTEPASVAAYQELARTAIDDVLARGRVPLLVGGSGLYLRAVLEEFDFPGTDPRVRAELEAR